MKEAWAGVDRRGQSKWRRHGEAKWKLAWEDKMKAWGGEMKKIIPLTVTQSCKVQITGGPAHQPRLLRR